MPHGLRPTVRRSVAQIKSAANGTKRNNPFGKPNVRSVPSHTRNGGINVPVEIT